MPNPTEIQLDPARLTALAAIARRSRATLIGLNDGLHDLRDHRRDLARQRDILLSASQASGPVARFEADQAAAGLAAQMADIVADITVQEVEQAEASDAYAAARSNVKAAIDHAKSVDLTIPAGIEEVLS